MSASLVGSEMCIRDRFGSSMATWATTDGCKRFLQFSRPRPGLPRAGRTACLLYTSDAADDM
eukprot:8027912-Alexandrium_andersonii.AAC.1